MADMPTTGYAQAWFRLAEATPGFPAAVPGSTSYSYSYSGWASSSRFENDPVMNGGLQRAAAVIERYGPALIRSFPQVTGVAASLRYAGGEIRPEEPCITFFVAEKGPHPRVFNWIPSRIDGVPTDVVEAGTPLLLKTPGHVPGLRARPAEPGMSVSHVRAGAGTFGCLVKDAYGQYVLSCAHVLSDALAIPGDPVLQQAPYYGGATPLDDIAKFTRAIPLVSGNNVADAAIAEAIDPAYVTASIRGIGTPAGTLSLGGVGLLVQKSGDTTGVTHGVVTGIKGTIGPLQVNGVANVYFTDAIITTGMSEPGDSGSLLMDYQDQAIGLLFGGLQFGSAYVVSWFSPIDAVLGNLGVTLAP